jgi:hypothetical protein
MQEVLRLYPTLPLFALFREIDYDETGDVLRVTPRTPHLSATVGGVKCLPLFTSIELATAFSSGTPLKSAIVECHAERLLEILEKIKPRRVIFDPRVDFLPNKSLYHTNHIIAWLRKEVGKTAP